LTAVADDTAQNAPGKLEFCPIEAILSDLASDVTGAIQHAADDNGREGRMSRASSLPTAGTSSEVRTPGHQGDDEPALIRLWKEKRGEVEPEDLSGNLIVQLGS